MALSRIYTPVNLAIRKAKTTGERFQLSRIGVGSHFQDRGLELGQDTWCFVDRNLGTGVPGKRRHNVASFF